MLRSLLRDRMPAHAMLGSSALFALCHVFHPGIVWSDALTGFACLMVTGMLFSYAAWNKSLWLSMGLHAPWIFFISLSSQHDLWAYHPDALLLTGNGYPPRGLMTLVVMGLGLVWMAWQRKSSLARA